MLAGLLAAALLASGCSDDDEPGGEQADETTASTTTTVPDVVASPGCEASESPATTATTTTVAEDGADAPQPERVDLADGPRPGWYFQSAPPGGLEPQPLVLDLHGYLEGAGVHVGHSKLSTMGREQGFLVITPQGTGERVFWNFRQQPEGPPDLAFLEAVLDEVESTHCVDRRRIFVTGLSNGAFMTSTLGCELADRIAAIAPVAGVRFEDGCEPARPLPVLAFHGTADTFVAYDPDESEEEPAPSGPTTTDPTFDDTENFSGTEWRPVVDHLGDWAEANGCTGDPSEERVGSDVVHVRWQGCPEGAEVELFRVDGGGHAWPGSDFSRAIERVVGKTTFEIDANDEMWAFFEAHPLPTAPPAP